MSLNFIRRDNTTAKETRLSTLYSDQFFTVGAGGAVDFVISGRTINATDPIQVFQNGIEDRETTDWTRNVAGNKITYSSTVPQNAVVKVRTWYL